LTRLTHRAELAAPVLALDYGRRRIGLAISDALGIIACPLKTLTRANRRKDVQQLRQVVREHSVRCIIVGHPLHLNGTPSEMGAEASRFAARLEKQLGLPVELVDERLSSWEAGQLPAARKSSTHKKSAASGCRRRRNVGRKHASVDHLAAAIILRDYLEHRRATSSIAPRPAATVADAARKQGRG